MCKNVGFNLYSYTVGEDEEEERSKGRDSVCMCVCVCVYVCMYVCMYVNLHTYEHTDNEYVEGVGEFLASKKQEIISGLSKLHNGVCNYF